MRKLQERIANETKIDLNQDIDNMVDSFYKYQIIVERAKKGGFDPYVDRQFPDTDESVGQECMGYFSSGLPWEKMSKIPEMNLFVDGVDATDIKQGSCGDCYLLSAFGVLGNKFTREKFIFIDKEDEWKKVGAFCVRFYDDGKESIVIVDDLIPWKNERAVFGTSTNRDEIWVGILEKAYAKKYGSYSII